MPMAVSLPRKRSSPPTSVASAFKKRTFLQVRDLRRRSLSLKPFTSEQVVWLPSV